MGYCLDDAAWDRGFATEAADALFQWAFDTLDLNRVQAETDTRNTASRPRAGKARLCARRHSARRLHREWRGVGFLGVWPAQAAVEVAAVAFRRDDFLMRSLRQHGLPANAHDA